MKGRFEGMMWDWYRVCLRSRPKLSDDSSCSVDQELFRVLFEEANDISDEDANFVRLFGGGYLNV